MLYIEGCAPKKLSVRTPLKILKIKKFKLNIIFLNLINYLILIFNYLISALFSPLTAACFAARFFAAICLGYTKIARNISLTSGPA